MAAMRLNAKQGFLDFSKRRVNIYEILNVYCKYQWQVIKTGLKGEILFSLGLNQEQVHFLIA